MRPGSEIQSALDLLQSELDRGPVSKGAANLSIARDVLQWVMGDRPPDDGPNLWLVGFLLDDPQQLGPSPEIN